MTFQWASRFQTVLMSVGALALMLVAAQVQAGGWTLGFKGGLADPRGDFEGLVKLGVVGGVDVDYRATPTLALGFDGSFVKFGDGELPIEAAGVPVTLKSKMLQGGGHLKYIFRESTFSPMVLIGLGGYRFKDGSESPDPFYTSDGAYETFFGFRTGLGATWRVNNTVAITVDGVFHEVVTALSWDSGYRAREFISLQTGLSMAVGTPAP